MRKIKTTNVLKRMNCGMNSELKKNTEKMEAFTLEQSLLRLVMTISNLHNFKRINIINIIYNYNKFKKVINNE
ncbi:hypothetical protein OXIME_000769 [Oxyplasma meridianum]|uniref:Uncharacterized protein n=1 Tax=Oxyplasma meridianum TaxID=3073602 RepID=A0AAX4NG07_9ARCH